MSLRKYVQEFAVLKETRKEFWGIQAINFLDSMYYFASVMIWTVFMTSNLGFSDIKAGSIITTIGIITSVAFFAAGPLVDRFGIKTSLWWSLLSLTVIRVALTVAAFSPGLPGRNWVFIVALTLGGFPMSVKSTIYQVGNRRFTSRKAQAAGFNIWYIIMNVGAFCAGLLVDLVHITLKLDFAWIIASGLVTILLSVPFALFLIKDETSMEHEPDHHDAPKAAGNGWSEKWRYAKEVFRHSAFLRMMLAVTLLLGVRAAFLYWAILSPKYWYRAIGPDARIGLINTINPIMIIAGLFLLVPIINKFSTFKMLTYGALIAALSFFPMAVPWYWISNDATTAYYIMSIVAMVAFSIGEIMFSPRLTHYIVAIAPVGQEGVYSSFSAMPWFIGKTVAGYFSGVLLTRWCPEKITIGGVTKPLHDAIAGRDLAYGHSPEMMWLILGLVALVGPLVMIPMKRWFTKGMREDMSDTPPSH